ncbi:MAG: hypothetical protein AVDCRST_MAG40-2548, partial [uncultured Gemmatimonadaceae bacterium]
AATQREAESQRGRVLAPVRRRAAQGAPRGARQRARGPRRRGDGAALPARRREPRGARVPPREARRVLVVRRRVARPGRARAAHHRRPARVPRLALRPRV